MCILNAVAPFLISQCYNLITLHQTKKYAVAPFLISQCYNCADIPKNAI